jgi:hypothetical protein
MTKQNFDQLQENLLSSGKSIKEFIAEYGMPLHQYYYWKKRHGNSESKHSNKFIQIGSAESLSSEIRLEYPNGVVINFQSNPGSKTLLELINSKH